MKARKDGRFHEHSNRMFGLSEFKIRREALDKFKNIRNGCKKCLIWEEAFVTVMAYLSERLRRKNLSLIEKIPLPDLKKQQQESY